MSSFELDELQRQLQDLLSHGSIESSSSPCGTPAFFIKKSDGSLLLVCDWRTLNKITIKVQACLPNIEDLSTLSAEQSISRDWIERAEYYQVKVNENDVYVPKTAINTPFGQYQFRVMGFGLTNAPATFMSLMNEVMRPFLRKCVIVFLDDILVSSSSWQEHLEHLESVLSALEEAELFCNGPKCLFAMQCVKFLGHSITVEMVDQTPNRGHQVACSEVSQGGSTVPRLHELLPTVHPKISIHVTSSWATGREVCQVYLECKPSTSFWKVPNCATRSTSPWIGRHDEELPCCIWCKWPGYRACKCWRHSRARRMETHGNRQNWF